MTPWMDTLYIVAETTGYVVGGLCLIGTFLVWGQNIVVGTLTACAAAGCLITAGYTGKKRKAALASQKARAVQTAMAHSCAAGTTIEAHQIPYLDAQTIDACNKRYIAIAVSTTGLDYDTDRIIELAATLFEGGIPTQRFATLVNPGRKISADVTQRTGITNAMLDAAPTEDRAILDFLRFLGDAAIGATVVVAHKARAHVDFIRLALARIEFPADFTFVDTLSISKILIDGLQDYKLVTVARHFGITVDPAQRAQGRADASGLVFAQLMRIK